MPSNVKRLNLKLDGPGPLAMLSPTRRGREPSLEKPSEMQRTVYLEEGVNSLFILSIHVVLRKQLEIWHESFAWSNIPGIRGEGSEGPNVCNWTAGRHFLKDNKSKEFELRN